nr:PadR family transcriptional regulator [Candidatus Njordarchaeum guaymaensis]
MTEDIFLENLYYAKTKLGFNVRIQVEFHVPESIVSYVEPYSALEVCSLAASESRALRRFISKLTRENLWFYILRLLQDGPRYGYEIRAMISERFGFKPATVTSYVILYKMAKDGLVEARRDVGGGEVKPDRKYYVITEEGKRAMEIAKAFLNKLIKNAFDLT